MSKKNKNHNKTSSKNIPSKSKEAHYYEKILLDNPKNPYTLYALACKYEFEAQNFKKNGEAVYKEKLKLALHYFQLALNNGYQESEENIERIENELYPKQPTPFKTSKKLLRKHLVVFIILVLSLLLLLNNVNDIGFTINQESAIDTLKHHTHYLHFDDSKSSVEIKNELMEITAELRMLNPKNSFDLTAIQTKSNGETEVAKIYSFPDKAEPTLINKNKKLDITYDEDAFSLAILRSALYHYVIKTGGFPHSLSDLTQDFPNNYISSIPVNTKSHKNHVKVSFDNTGGWFYSPPEDFTLDHHSVSDLEELIATSLKPNFKHPCTKRCDFTPLEIHIDKTTHRLDVLMNGVSMWNFEVGLGKDDSTPEGIFKITKRVAFPNFQISSSTPVFGTRGLELSDARYAIHGTYKDSSIGKNVSHGCIRLTNSDIESLFSMIPLHTNVMISNDSYTKESSAVLENNPSNTSPSKNSNNNSNSNSEGTGDSVGRDSLGSGITNSSGDEAANKGQSEEFIKERDLMSIYHWSM
ncbi:L,D-transpeptidase [Lysinibacillus yapensis]|uniref:L,D-transpeptidase n=1 Tax=Ureibacillus yapensis TaxID=2304605 RepID=A0A396S925_9BACL|nr:L,D-transpeptidase [Lysinibacillus yapensis]RHW37595.1 L,D-transpeptidase [Lysinibacillus yapensis]